jgi:hypothetical protein
MRRIPFALALLTAVFLIACNVESGLRGLNPDVESDWVLHPAWWQSDTLADWGFFLIFPSLYESVLLSHFMSLDERSAAIFFLLSPLLTIAVTSFVVFLVAKFLIRFSRPAKWFQASS